MDPVVLATVTSALTTLGMESLKGIGSSAGKDLWAKVRSVLGWKADPAPEQLAPMIAQRLADDPELTTRLTDLLKGNPSEIAGQMVGSIIGGKVVVSRELNAQIFNM
jgi:hypothetical protein